MAGEKAVKVQHVIHVPPPPPAPPGCADLDSHCAQVPSSGLCHLLVLPIPNRQQVIIEAWRQSGG